MNRCDWCVGDDLYESYHDNEWGKPVYDDKVLFEFLILEGAQAGLNWLTILRRRPAYKEAFDDFDVHLIAGYDQEKINRLLDNPGIIRNKLKVKSAIKNAQAFIRVQEEFGSFSSYYWSFVDKPIINHFDSTSDVPAQTDLSKAISKDLKKRGFSFVGPTIIYAYMQATGMVNDHVKTCHLYEKH